MGSVDSKILNSTDKIIAIAVQKYSSDMIICTNHIEPKEEWTFSRTRYFLQKRRARLYIYLPGNEIADVCKEIKLGDNLVVSCASNGSLKIEINLKMMTQNNEISQVILKKKRGRPCAKDRYKTDLIQQKFTNILNSNKLVTDEFTKQNILPFIVKRQRRQRANNRERTRMQTLNGALHVLKQHLPLDLYLHSKTNAQSQSDSFSTDSSSSKEKKFLSKENNGDLSTQVKMTKIDTLKFAAEYIKLLTSVLNETNNFNSNGFNSSFNSDTSSTSSTFSVPANFNEFISNNSTNFNFYNLTNYNSINSSHYCYYYN